MVRIIKRYPDGYCPPVLYTTEFGPHAYAISVQLSLLFSVVRGAFPYLGSPEGGGTVVICLSQLYLYLSLTSNFFFFFLWTVFWSGNNLLPCSRFCVIFSSLQTSVLMSVICERKISVPKKGKAVQPSKAGALSRKVSVTSVGRMAPWEQSPWSCHTFQMSSHGRVTC